MNVTLQIIFGGYEFIIKIISLNNDNNLNIITISFINLLKEIVKNLNIKYYFLNIKEI